MPMPCPAKAPDKTVTLTLTLTLTLGIFNEEENTLEFSMTVASGYVADTDADDADSDGSDENEPSILLPVYTDGFFTVYIKFILVQ